MKKILQIIPADGWYACFKEIEPYVLDEGEGGYEEVYHYYRVVVWALVQDDDGTTSTQGMIVNPLEERLTLIEDNYEGFTYYYPETKVPEEERE